MQPTAEPCAVDDAPDWFSRAVATPGDSNHVLVNGCRIHYLSWGDRQAPGLLFVPPSGGHAHWFSHVAPLFEDRFHVAAMDPSGCRDSGRRAQYSQELLTAEIKAVCTDAGMFQAKTPPTLVGHSAGAQSVVRAALTYGAALLGIIAIDGIRYAELEKDHAIKILSGPRPAPKPSRIHTDRETAVASFRLMPAPLKPIGARYVIDHIARHSVHPVEGGWASKFDTAQGGIVTLGLEGVMHSE